MYYLSSACIFSNLTSALVVFLVFSSIVSGRLLLVYSGHTLLASYKLFFMKQVYQPVPLLIYLVGEL